MMQIAVKKLRQGAMLPTFGSQEAAGADLYACLEAAVTIQPGETAFIPTGLAMELPRGYVGLIYARSGLACKRGLAPANKVGVIDSDYRGNLSSLFTTTARRRKPSPTASALPSWWLAPF